MRRKNRALPVTVLCLAAGLAAAGCDSSLPSLNEYSDWEQREQDRNDAGNLIDDITGSPKRWNGGGFGGVGMGAPPAGLGRGEEPAVWSETAQAWTSSGVTLRREVEWDWTFLLRVVDGNGDPQQLPDGTTDRIEVVLTADGARTFDAGGVVTQQTMSWLVVGTITGTGTGTLDVSVVGTLDSQAVTAGEVTDLPAEFRVDASVPEATDDCPTGTIVGRIAGFTVRGTLDEAGEEIDWEVYEGEIEQGEEPFERSSQSVECEPAP